VAYPDEVVAVVRGDESDVVLAELAVIAVVHVEETSWKTPKQNFVNTPFMHRLMIHLKKKSIVNTHPRNLHMRQAYSDPFTRWLIKKNQYHYRTTGCHRFNETCIVAAICMNLFSSPNALVKQDHGARFTMAFREENSSEHGIKCTVDRSS
jgi:hypothetical protein